MRDYGNTWGNEARMGGNHLSVDLRELYLITIGLSSSREECYLVAVVRFCRMESWPRTEKSTMKKTDAN